MSSSVSSGLAAGRPRSGPPFRLRPAHVVPVVALVVFAGLLLRHVQTLDFALVAASLRAASLGDWALAALFTAISLSAVGQYDAGVHRMLGTGIAPAAARRAGIRAVALSQTLGFGTLTGALVRWRSLPDLTLWTATRVSALVTLSFLGSWAIVTAAVLWLAPPEGPFPEALVWGGTALAAAIAAVVLLRARARPDSALRIDAAGLARLLVWTTVDTGAAALALWVLLPDTAPVSFLALFAAYLLALGAGLASNAPGGVGAFELALMTLLPVPEAEPLLAAILAFRLVYYIAPALLALPGLFRAPTAAPSLRLARPGALPPGGLPGEWTLLQQGARLAHDRSGAWLTRLLPGHLVALGPPTARMQPGQFAALARGLGRAPLLYKADAATAAAARRLGWRTLRLAAEATLDPRTWTAAGPATRQLRRKLAACQRAGVTIAPAPTADPAALAGVHADWCVRFGPERGFSMGRFDPALIARQILFTAHHEGRLVAFATFHRGADDWTLDLMRHRADAPPGTMHGLVAEAIAAARNDGIARLSLAAVPDLGHLPHPLASRADPGLRQFKQSFAPRWTPRYAAAPSLTRLALGLALVTLAVHRPAWLDLWMRLADGNGDRDGKGAARLPKPGIDPRFGPDFHPGPQFGFETAPLACDATGQLLTAGAAAPARRPPAQGPESDDDRRQRPVPPA